MYEKDEEYKGVLGASFAEEFVSAKNYQLIGKRAYANLLRKYPKIENSLTEIEMPNDLYLIHLTEEGIEHVTDYILNVLVSQKSDFSVQDILSIQRDTLSEQFTVLKKVEKEVRENTPEKSFLLMVNSMKEVNSVFVEDINLMVPAVGLDIFNPKTRSQFKNLVVPTKDKSLVTIDELVEDLESEDLFKLSEKYKSVLVSKDGILLNLYLKQ